MLKTTKTLNLRF